MKNVITNSTEYGLIPQRDFFDKDIAVDGNTANYYVIEEDYSYPRRMSAVKSYYGNQQEYRFLIEPPTTENDYYELDIGDISDISVVLTAKEALNAMALPINGSTD